PKELKKSMVKFAASHREGFHCMWLNMATPGDVFTLSTVIRKQATPVISNHPQITRKIFRTSSLLIFIRDQPYSQDKNGG
ncbi:hypothetical protein BK796_23635, partial [Kosakonia pseudosacchari]